MVKVLDLRLKRSRVRISAVPLSGNNFGQVVVTIGLASHWPCVTDFSGLSTYTGSRPKEFRAISTSLALLMGYGTTFLLR